MKRTRQERTCTSGRDAPTRVYAEQRAMRRTNESSNGWTRVSVRVSSVGVRKFVLGSPTVRVAERSKAPDSRMILAVLCTVENSGPHLRAWVRIPLLTEFFWGEIMRNSRNLYIKRGLKYAATLVFCSVRRRTEVRAYGRTKFLAMWTLFF